MPLKVKTLKDIKQRGKHKNKTNHILEFESSSILLFQSNAMWACPVACCYSSLETSLLTTAKLIQLMDFVIVDRVPPCGRTLCQRGQLLHELNGCTEIHCTSAL